MYDMLKVDRRGFISQALGLSVIGIGALELVACTADRSRAIASTNPVGAWRAQITSAEEPGERLVVSGRIFTPDGKSPLPGISLYVYQTDAGGRYSTTGGDNRNTRLHGAMVTNAEGRYEFHTIKPGSYPGSRVPAHIHAYVSGPGYPEYWIDEYWFQDDPFVKDDDKQKFSSAGSFSPILKVTRSSDGVLNAVRDIKIEKCSRNCTGR